MQATRLAGRSSDAAFRLSHGPTVVEAQLLASRNRPDCEDIKPLGGGEPPMHIEVESVVVDECAHTEDQKGGRAAVKGVAAEYIRRAIVRTQVEDGLTRNMLAGIKGTRCKDPAASSFDGGVGHER